MDGGDTAKIEYLINHFELYNFHTFSDDRRHKTCKDIKATDDFLGEISNLGSEFLANRIWRRGCYDKTR